MTEDANFLEQLERLDHPVQSVVEPPSCAAPTPLRHRLIIPEPPELGQRSGQSNPFSGLSEDRKPETAGVVPDAFNDTSFDGLDQGLDLQSDSARSALTPRTPMFLALPDVTGLWPEAALSRPTVSPTSKTVSGWMVSASLVLLMFAGAAGAALVFHARLAAVVGQLITRLK